MRSVVGGCFDGGASEIHTVKRGSTEALTARFQAKGRDLERIRANHCPVPHKSSNGFLYAAVDFHFTRLFINCVGLMMEFLFWGEMSIPMMRGNPPFTVHLYIPVLLV